MKYVDLLDVATGEVTEWFAQCETVAECEQLVRDMRGQLDIVRGFRVASILRASSPRRRWRVTALRSDGVWVPVDIEADNEGDAVDEVLALTWVENVVECEPLATLNEEVVVLPEGGDSVTVTTLREVSGTRRWVPCGESGEDWWRALDGGMRLPGEWEYDRDTETVVCSLA